jgi:hypothetical protein
VHRLGSVHRLVDSGTSSSLARWCGIAAVVGGVLFAAWGYLHRDERDLFLTKADAPLFLRLVAVLVPLLFFIALVGICARLAGEMRFLGWIGFFLAFWGCGLGLVHGVVDDDLLYGYFVERGWPGLLLRWLPPLLVGLVLVGTAAAKARVLGCWSPLLLVAGLSGWSYYLTDVSVGTELRTVHVVFGVLFSSCWIAIGYALGAGRDLSERGRQQ